MDPCNDWYSLTYHLFMNYEMTAFEDGKTISFSHALRSLGRIPEDLIMLHD